MFALGLGYLLLNVVPYTGAILSRSQVVCLCNYRLSVWRQDVGAEVSSTLLTDQEHIRQCKGEGRRAAAKALIEEEAKYLEHWRKFGPEAASEDQQMDGSHSIPRLRIKDKADAQHKREGSSRSRSDDLRTSNGSVDQANQDEMAELDWSALSNEEHTLTVEGGRRAAAVLPTAYL